MSRRTVDLAAHINHTVERGHPADFPVVLRPLYYSKGAGVDAGYVPKRLAVVHGDTGECLAVVSDRYKLVRHQQLLDLVRAAAADLDVGPVPRGVYVDRRGARMRAIFKFPALARSVFSRDEICPCIKIENTYDATSRITVHIGAFRFVCTNLAVGGGGVFAGGFMAVHAGEIPVQEIGRQLSDFLSNFEGITTTYRRWTEERFGWDQMEAVLRLLPKNAGQTIESGIRQSKVQSVYSAYNVATNHATHRMRSARSAFDLLELINRGFQQQFGPNNTGDNTRPGAKAPGRFFSLRGKSRLCAWRNLHSHSIRSILIARRAVLLHVGDTKRNPPFQELQSTTTTSDATLDRPAPSSLRLQRRAVQP